MSFGSKSWTLTWFDDTLHRHYDWHWFHHWHLLYVYIRIQGHFDGRDYTFGGRGRWLCNGCTADKGTWTTEVSWRPGDVVQMWHCYKCKLGNRGVAARIAAVGYWDSRGASAIPSLSPRIRRIGPHSGWVLTEKYFLEAGIIFHRVDTVVGSRGLCHPCDSKIPAIC